MKNTEYKKEKMPAKSLEDLILWKRAQQCVPAIKGLTI
jgi:hypothetical protein